jgi:MOSC domain-containing protein YiiM
MGEMNRSRGRVLALSVSERTGTPKANVPKVRLVEDWGIDGDAHAGKWHRQVSLLATESIARMRALGVDVGPGAFAENITTESLEVPNLRIGDRIIIGEAELEVTQIGKECHAGCAIFEQVGECVMPKEGVFARVLRGGAITVGDAIEVLPAASAVSL